MIIGSSLAHYTIVRKLGSGGMGEVYLAHDTRLGREVALKVLLADVAADPDRRARLEREARAVATLSHPNIVTVHSIEHAGDLHFITMELVAGKALSAIIPRDGLPLKQFFALALPLTDAVGAAHERGVTHRDLKPENVMVGDDGRVKVLDFGLAKIRPGFIDGAAETATISAQGRTLQGQIIGTTAYMSPEQAEGKVLDHRSDIFSLGILLHEMITGRRPFGGASHASIVSSILRDVPPPITKMNPELPARLGRIVQRCLEKEPSRRYQSAVDLRNDLSELEEDVRSGLRDAMAARATARPGRSLNGGAITGIVAVLAMAAAGAYWLLGASDDATSRLEALGETAFDQLTHLSGEELFPSLSPDGRVIVYVSAAQGNLDIYAQRVGGENPINLTRDAQADDSQPAFSPDGEHVAFRSERDGGGIFVMGATGESPRLVANFGYHPAWSPDGQQLVCMTQSVTDPSSRFTTSQLWVITPATGERRLLSEGDAAQPHWSPKGHRIAYWARTAEAGAGDIFTIPAQGGGSPVAVTSDAPLDWNPVWSGDGRHLYFASNRGGSMNLWRIGIDEVTGRPRGRPQAVTTGGGTSDQHLSISSDGKRIAYVSRVETMNMRRVSFDPATGTAKGSPEWVIRGSRAVVEPEPSPDGMRLAFSTAGTSQDIVIGNADGTAEQLLTDDAFKDRGPRWSPDGRRIAFYSDRTGQNEIWTINRDGTGRQQLTRSPGAHYPVWSPDGLRMAYSTHSPNGAFIFDLVRPWDQQTPTPLPAITDTTQTFEIWSWSPDGRRLAGQKHLADLSHAGIGIHEIGSKEIQWLTDFGEWPVWLRDSRRLLFSHRGKLSLLDTVSGRHYEVLSLPQPTLGAVGLSTDDRTIYFTAMAAEADVWLMTIK